MPAGRPHTLADPTKAKLAAELFVAGCTRQEVADAMGVKDLDTITRWRRDPRVKTIASRLIEDRVLEVHRKVDSVIAQRLQDAENLTVKELLDIRKEFVGGKFRREVEGADEDTVSEAMEAIENNPNFVEELAELFKKKQTQE